MAHIYVVGGAGRVGLPLSVLLAERLPGVRVTIVDASLQALAAIRNRRTPFAEPQLQARLEAAYGRNLDAEERLIRLGKSDVVVITLAGRTYADGGAGSPCYEFVEREATCLHKAGAVLFTGTLPPGMFARMQRLLMGAGGGPAVAYCPERFAEGAALEEMTVLPQIIAADTDAGLVYAQALFGAINPTLLESTIAEAEIVKLLTNAWRYLEFAVANEMVRVLQQHGVDYERVLRLMRYRYPRLAGRPMPGFAGGPCLPNDVRILVDSGYTAPLARAALDVNLAMPQVVVDLAAERIELSGATVALLGMAFKAESDDCRGSLSEPLARLLEARGATVLCSDEYVAAPHYVTRSEALKRADLVIFAVPHAAYRGLALRQPYIDLWGVIAPETP